MHKPSTQLAFITVNYNGIQDTRALINSIQALRLTIEYSIVVIDNGSVINEWASLLNEFPFLLGGRSEVNLGFAGGNNLGLTMVDAEYYYFINNDTILPIDAGSQIEDMIQFLASDSSIGGASPKIKYVEPANLLQYAGCTPLSRVTLRNRQIGYKEEDEGQYDEIVKVPYMHGAAMLVRGQVIKEIGPMPDLYFLYYEELDWCEQILKRFQLFYYPRAVILHKESASTGVDSPFKKYYLSRNRLIYAFRNRKGVERIASIIYLTAIQVVKALAEFVKGNSNSCKAILNGVKEGLVWGIRTNNS